MFNDIRKRNALTLLRWVCYSALLILCYVLQTTPHLFEIASSIKPILIVPLCISVAVFEGEFSGAIFGAIGGMMWDMASGRLAGTFAILLLVMCFASGVVIKLILRPNAFNAMALSFVAMLIITGLDFIFGYLLFGYPAAAKTYFGHIFPIIVYSSAIMPVIFMPVNAIYKKVNWQD